MRNILGSGVVPQISVIMGPCAGGDVYSPAMTDFIFMVKDTSYMYVTGPDVVKTVTNEIVTHEELGGARVHAAKSGVVDGAFENDFETLGQMRRLIDFLPLSNQEKPPERPSYDDPLREEVSLDRLIPDNPNKPYDMKELIEKVVDEGDFFEISADFGKNIIIGFGRMDGAPVGFVANQPMTLAGVLGYRRLAQSGALRALLRCVQHSDRHLCRRAGLPAGHAPRTRRPDQARREIAVRLWRSDGAESHRDHAQSLWRRL